MNAILKQRNAERLSSIIGIERTGNVSPETLSLIQTMRGEESSVAIGFSNGDLGYYLNFYRVNKLKQAEQALAHVKGLWQDANVYLMKLKQPGFKMNPKIQAVEDERNRLYTDLRSIHTRIDRINKVINTLTDEQERRERIRQASIPVIVPIIEAPKVETSISPTLKVKKSQVKANPPKDKYKPEISVFGGFGGLAQALQYKQQLVKA